MTDPADVRGSWARERDTLVVSDLPSPTRVDAPFAILTASTHTPVPLEFAPHTHPLHELVWVLGGTMTVHLPDRVVTVPEGHGLWIPAGVVHSGRMTARTVLGYAYVEPARSPIDFPAPTTVAVPPVLAALLGHLERTDLQPDARLRAEAVVLDLVEPSDRQLVLEVPRSSRIGPIVDALADDPVDDRSLRDWARLVGSSERTVARAFRHHTGLSYAQWRQSLRMHHAMGLLTEGLPVSEVAGRCGYAQASTFIAAFRRSVGTTPGEFSRR